MRNLKASSSLASTALPVIFGLVIFTFFSTWMWQLTDHLPWHRIAMLAVVIAVIATVVLLPSARGVFEDEQGRALDLTRLQRANVLIVVVVSQLVLAGVFALLLAGLLIVLGKVALSPAALEVWLRHPPTTLHIGSATLPISGNLLKGALFLSTIASLTFIISIAGDTANRKQFFEPAVAELRRLIGDRDDRGGASSEDDANP